MYIQALVNYVRQADKCFGLCELSPLFLILDLSNSTLNLIVDM